MKLQIALDLVDTNTALKMVEKIQDIIDIVEIGTPMIVKEGMAPVKAMKEKFPQVTVLADVKIADGGAIESGYAVDAGADIVTVLAIASDQTIMGARDAAHKAGRRNLCGYAQRSRCGGARKRTGRHGGRLYRRTHRL